MKPSRDEVLGLGVLAVAVAYWAAADQLQVSLLSDAVGADGVPKVLAVGLGVVGALLAVTSRLRLSGRMATASGVADATAEPFAWASHRRAAGLLASLVAYVLLLPVLGYPIALALLLAGVAVYGGTALTRSIAIVAIPGAALFWVFFAKVLGIGVPVGFWAPGY